MFKRIALFLATNLAVLLVISVLLSVLGLNRAELGAYGEIDFKSLLAYSAVIGFTGSIISLLLSKTMAKWSTGAQIITSPRSETESWLLQTVHRQAERAGIGKPDVAIYQSPDPNAFATGAFKNHALVAVSTGLLNAMSRSEVEAVLAHEVSHVANGDMVTLTLIQGVLNTFVIFLSRLIGFLVDSFLSGRREGEERRGSGMAFFAAQIVSQIVLGILASLIVAWFSRRREFRADAGSAGLNGSAAMVSALRKLQQMHPPTMLPTSFRSFGIHGGGFFELFASHPPLEKRIAALEQRPVSTLR